MKDQLEEKTKSEENDLAAIQALGAMKMHNHHSSHHNNNILRAQRNLGPLIHLNQEPMKGKASTTKEATIIIKTTIAMRVKHIVWIIKKLNLFF